MIEQGQLRLPELQRRYIWPATRVRDLLDSLYRGYPSGTILVWQTDQEVPSRDLAVDQARSPFTPMLLWTANNGSHHYQPSSGASR
jgi:Protein of unknown function DUF262